PLRDRISVMRPAESAREVMEDFLRSLTAADGVARIRLRVPVNGTTGVGLAFDREVVVEARRERTEHDCEEVVRVAWTSEGSAVFPRFAGTLSVFGNGKPGQSLIALDGCYTSPVGAAGQVYDAAIGHEIGRATA